RRLAVRRGLGPGGSDGLHAEGAQLLHRAHLDLPNALAADAELLAERGQGGRPSAEGPRLDDGALAGVEDLERLDEPALPVVARLDAGDDVLGVGAVLGEHLALLARVVEPAGRVERDVAAREARRHRVELVALDAERVGERLGGGGVALPLDLP